MKMLLLFVIAGFAGVAQAQNPQLKIVLDADAEGEITEETVLVAFNSEHLKLPYVTLVSDRNTADAVLEIYCVSWRAKTGLGCYVVANVFTDRFLTAKIKAAHFENRSDLDLALSLATGTMERPPRQNGSWESMYYEGNADIGAAAKVLVSGFNVAPFKDLLAIKQ
jgi:hypothetical protein